MIYSSRCNKIQKKTKISNTVCIGENSFIVGVVQIIEYAVVATDYIVRKYVEV